MSVSYAEVGNQVTDVSSGNDFFSVDGKSVVGIYSYGNGSSCVIYNEFADAENKTLKALVRYPDGKVVDGSFKVESLPGIENLKVFDSEAAKRVFDGIVQNRPSELHEVVSSQDKEPQLTVTMSRQAEQDAARIRAGIQAERDAEEAIVREAEREAASRQAGEPVSVPSESHDAVQSGPLEPAWSGIGLSLDGPVSLEGRSAVAAYSDDGFGNRLVVYDGQVPGMEGSSLGVLLDKDGKAHAVSLSKFDIEGIDGSRINDKDAFSLAVSDASAAMSPAMEKDGIGASSHESAAPQEKDMQQKDRTVSGPDVAAASPSAWQQDLLINGEPFVGAYSNDGTGNPLVVYGKEHPSPDGGSYNGVRLFGNGMGQLVSVGKRFLSSLTMHQVTDEFRVLQLARMAESVVKKLVRIATKPVPFGNVATKAMGKAASAAITAGAAAVNALGKSDLAKKVKDSSVGRVSGAVRAGVAAARSAMSGIKASASRAGISEKLTRGISSDPSKVQSQIHRETRRIKVAVYDVNGSKLAVMNRRSRDGKGYAAVWLDGAKYPRVTVSDKDLGRFHGSFRSVVCGMDDKAKMSEIKKSNFNLLNEHKAKGLVAALGLEANVAFVPDYGFADNLMGKGRNPLIKQESDVLIAAKNGKLPMFRKGDAVIQRPGEQDYYDFPAVCILDGARRSRLSGMAALSLLAQCADKNIAKVGNAYVLTADETRRSPVTMSVATLSGGAVVTPMTKANVYDVGVLSIGEPSRKVSGILDRRTENLERSRRTGNVTHFIDGTRASTLMEYMGAYMAAAQLGVAFKTNSILSEKFRDEFVKTAGELGRSGRFGDFYRKFNNELTQTSDRIARDKKQEWKQERNPEQRRELKISRDLSPSMGMAMGL